MSSILNILKNAFKINFRARARRENPRLNLARCHNKDCALLSEVRESNPRLILGKDTYYHCTNLAYYLCCGTGLGKDMYYQADVCRLPDFSILTLKGVSGLY